MPSATFNHQTIIVVGHLNTHHHLFHQRCCWFPSSLSSPSHFLLLHLSTPDTFTISPTLVTTIGHDHHHHPPSHLSSLYLCRRRLVIHLVIMEIDGEQKENFGVLVNQGAEGRVFESTFIGRRCIIKERFSKKYRHPSLDTKLTLKRLNAEARCLTKARRLGVPTPVLYAVDPLLHTLTFEYVDGPSVKEVLLDFGSHGVVEEKLDDIATQIGDAIGKLHDGGLVHGDLTTSNMIIQSGKNQLVLIDFGLSFMSTLPEDKAVDLYVLERALLSMHSSCGNVMEIILSGYRKSSKQWSSTLNKLAQVRQRGRKRTMLG